MKTMYQKIDPKERLCTTRIFQSLEREKRFVQDVKKEMAQAKHNVFGNFIQIN